MNLSKLIVIAVVAAITTCGCAGMNPNPGERTIDTAWTAGDYARAFALVKPHAEAGEPWAQLRLGIFFENGWGTEQNASQAESWYRKAAAQTATGDWAEGKLVGAVGKNGYFNQNSDALIARFNLAQLYLKESRSLPEAKDLIDTVIKESDGKAVFFCCEFSGGRYFTQEQFLSLRQKIETSLGHESRS